MSPTKVLMLPSKPNRAMINAMAVGYVNEDFRWLSSSVAQLLGNDMAKDSQDFAKDVFKTLTHILLDNVMCYVVEAEHHRFSQALSYNQFIPACRVRVKYLDGLFHTWSPIREDKDDVEEGISHLLLQWLNQYHNDYQGSLNPSLMEIYESMILYTPHRYVRTYRFETDPELRPILIYTDCLHETATV